MRNPKLSLLLRRNIQHQGSIYSGSLLVWTDTGMSQDERRLSREVIIIHLGSNDFDVDTQMGIMLHRTKYATDAFRQMIQHTVAIFSLLLPRRFNNNFADQRKALKVRRKVNSSIAKLAFSNGLHTISHPNINPNNPTTLTWTHYICPTMVTAYC